MSNLDDILNKLIKSAHIRDIHGYIVQMESKDEAGDKKSPIDDVTLSQSEAINNESSSSHQSGAINNESSSSINRQLIANELKSDMESEQSRFTNTVVKKDIILQPDVKQCNLLQDKQCFDAISDFEDIIDNPKHKFQTNSMDWGSIAEIQDPHPKSECKYSDVTKKNTPHECIVEFPHHHGSENVMIYNPMMIKLSSKSVQQTFPQKLEMRKTLPDPAKLISEKSRNTASFNDSSDSDHKHDACAIKKRHHRSQHRRNKSTESDSEKERSVASSSSMKHSDDKKCQNKKKSSNKKTSSYKRDEEVLLLKELISVIVNDRARDKYRKYRSDSSSSSDYSSSSYSPSPERKTKPSRHSSRKRESKHVSRKRESRHVSRKRETTHSSSTRESRHSSPTREVRHVSRKRKSRHVSRKRESTHSSPTREIRHVSRKRKSRHVSPTREVRHVSRKRKSRHVSREREARSESPKRRETKSEKHVSQKKEMISGKFSSPNREVKNTKYTSSTNEDRPPSHKEEKAKSHTTQSSKPMIVKSAKKENDPIIFLPMNVNALDFPSLPEREKSLPVTDTEKKQIHTQSVKPETIHPKNDDKFVTVYTKQKVQQFSEETTGRIYATYSEEYLQSEKKYVLTDRGIYMGPHIHNKYLMRMKNLCENVKYGTFTSSYEKWAQIQSYTDVEKSKDISFKIYKRIGNTYINRFDQTTERPDYQETASYTMKHIPANSGVNNICKQVNGTVGYAKVGEKYIILQSKNFAIFRSARRNASIDKAAMNISRFSWANLTKQQVINDDGELQTKTVDQWIQVPKEGACVGLIFNTKKPSLSPKWFYPTVEFINFATLFQKPKFIAGNLTQYDIQQIFYERNLYVNTVKDCQIPAEMDPITIPLITYFLGTGGYIPHKMENLKVFAEDRITELPGFSSNVGEFVHYFEKFFSSNYSE